MAPPYYAKNLNFLLAGHCVCFYSRLKWSLHLSHLNLEPPFVLLILNLSLITITILNSLLIVWCPPLHGPNHKTPIRQFVTICYCLEIDSITICKFWKVGSWLDNKKNGGIKLWCCSVPCAKEIDVKNVSNLHKI